MQADATLVALGVLLLVLVGCAALVWLGLMAQTRGTEFRGEIRSRMFTFTIESRPGSRGTQPEDPSPLGSRTATAQHRSAADQS